MLYEELEHLARAAADLAGVRRVLIVGSQAILGSWKPAELPSATHASIEADIAVLEDLRGSSLADIEVTLGYMSDFHRHNDYYADAVDLAELTLPIGWEGRVVHAVSRLGNGDPLDIYFLHPEDLCAAKLGAGRPQDRRFVQALTRHRFGDGTCPVDLLNVRARAESLNDDHGSRTRALALVDVLLRDGIIDFPNPPT